MPKEGEAWTVCRFKGGLTKKRGGGVFEGELIPQCTLCYRLATPFSEELSETIFWNTCKQLLTVQSRFTQHISLNASQTARNFPPLHGFHKNQQICLAVECYFSTICLHFVLILSMQFLLCSECMQYVK